MCFHRLGLKKQNEWTVNWMNCKLAYAVSSNRPMCNLQNDSLQKRRSYKYMQGVIWIENDYYSKVENQ